MNDQIIDEIRSYREKYARKFNFDLDHLFYGLTHWQSLAKNIYPLNCSMKYRAGASEKRLSKNPSENEIARVNFLNLPN